MRAVVIVRREGAARPDLDYTTVPDPRPGPTELLVKVQAAGMNRIDLARSTAHGGHSVGRPLIAGLEIAGEVIGHGNAVSRFKSGDRVMGMTTGAYAELATIDERVAMPVPPSFSYDQAAAVAIVYPTAYNALITHGELRTGQSVLIQGAASAVGIAALQIAKASGAHRVIGTGRSVTRGATLPSLALDRYLVVGTDDIAAEVSRLTDGCGVGVIIDMVGGAALADNITSIALGGRIVNVGWMGGTKGELDLDALARKRVTLIGVSFRTRTLEQKAELFQAFTRDMFPFFESGALRPIVQRTYPLAQAAAAQSAMALDEHLGKIVLHP